MNTDEKLLAKFIQGHTSEIVLEVEELPGKDIVALLESFSVDLTVILLSQMDRFIAARSLEKMDFGIAIQLIEKLPFYIAELLLRQIDPELCNSILAGLPRQVSTPLKQIIKYPKNSVGAYLDPGVFTLFEDNSIERALEKIKANKSHIESHIFILSRNQKLVGFIELKQLITTDANKQIRSIVKRDLLKVSADMNISEIKDVLKKDELHSQLPVVDSEDTFLGVITRESLSIKDSKKSTQDLHASQTSSALGDLYKIGLSSLFRSASEIVGNQNLK